MLVVEITSSDVEREDLVIKLGLRDSMTLLEHLLMCSVIKFKRKGIFSLCFLHVCVCELCLSTAILELQATGSL